MSEATTLTCLRGIEDARVELYELSHSEDISARDAVDLSSSIELLELIGKRGPVRNSSLVLRLSQLLVSCCKTRGKVHLNAEQSSAGFV